MSFDSFGGLNSRKNKNEIQPMESVLANISVMDEEATEEEDELESPSKGMAAEKLDTISKK